MKTVLLVIPNFRDGERLRPFARDLIGSLGPSCTVLVSDDGSGAGEVERLKSLIEDLRRESGETGPRFADPAFHYPNSGKGAAVRRGWEEGMTRAGSGSFDFVAFADADGAVSATEILRGFRRMEEENAPDALFASRVMMLGRSITRSLRRHLSGRVFATLVHLISGTHAYDTQCGFKILSRRSYETIRGDLQAPGFAFDVEILMLLERAGLRVEEFPVDWHDVPGSKVHLLRDSIRMTREILAIRSRIRTLDRG